MRTNGGVEGNLRAALRQVAKTPEGRTAQVAGRRTFTSTGNRCELQTQTGASPQMNSPIMITLRQT
jgi:hypothetical protein